MSVEERLATAQKKIDQYEHKMILQENRNKNAKTKIDLRRKILVGEMFLKHFPIAMDFTPGKSSDEDARVFEPLNNFMESLSQCQQLYQIMEDALVQSK